MSQAQKLTLASRAFSTDCLGEFALYMTSYFGYDRVLPMVRLIIGTAVSVTARKGWHRFRKGHFVRACLHST